MSEIQRVDAARPILDRRRISLRYRATLPSTADSVRRAARRIGLLAGRAGCVGVRRADFEIALHEALANAVIHGAAGDPRRTFRVRCYGEPGEGIVVAVRDQGPGFDPAAVPDPTRADRLQLHHGRGLFLVRQLTDFVEHRKRGREIVFAMRCPPARGPGRTRRV